MNRRTFLKNLGAVAVSLSMLGFGISPPIPGHPSRSESLVIDKIEKLRRFKIQ